MVGGVGGFLALIGLARVFGVRTPLDTFVSAVPLCLAVGVLLIAYAVYLWRLFRPAPRTQWRTMGEWLGVFILVGLSLFWAASDYSAAVGRSRAVEFVSRMPAYPTVIGIAPRASASTSRAWWRPGARTPTRRTGTAIRGLKLLLQSGNQYVMVPRRGPRRREWPCCCRATTRSASSRGPPRRPRALTRHLLTTPTRPTPTPTLPLDPPLPYPRRTVFETCSGAATTRLEQCSTRLRPGR